LKTAAFLGSGHEGEDVISIAEISLHLWDAEDSVINGLQESSADDTKNLRPDRETIHKSICLPFPEETSQEMNRFTITAPFTQKA